MTITKSARTPARADEDRHWQAVLARDWNFDGVFYFSVATTGIYCRPSCPARHARRENVAFHASWREAEAAGFRPCKRCKPREPSPRERYAAQVAEACRVIESAEEAPPLAELAAAAGLSTWHFHRVFKAIAGVTPKAYAIARRRERLRENLKGSDSVTAAIHSSGYSSAGRFYASADETLGMTPAAYRTGGAGQEMRFGTSPCSLGAILVAASDKGVTAIMLGDDAEALERDLRERFPNAKLSAGGPAFEEILGKAVALVEAPQASLDLPLDIRGTAFQHRVWQALREIPAGSTASYTEIARRIGMPKAARAVAAACAANRIAVAIPCHRVVKTDGSLSGYRWGTDRKRALIEREAAGSRKPRRSGATRKDGNG